MSLIKKLNSYQFLQKYVIVVLCFVCLFALFGFYLNILSVISRLCLDVTGSSMLTFRVLPH